MKDQMRSWWNGRHGGLKYRYLTVCRFKSGGAYELVKFTYDG